MTARSALIRIEQIRSAHLRRHERGVGRTSAALARALGKDDGYIEALAVAAELHDVGKLAIPDEILEKPGKLETDEREIIERHTRHGFDILKSANSDLSDLAASVAHNHHECWDGRGYPRGLTGEGIPHEARIVSLCDVYDALREVRAYKAPRTHDEVMHMICTGACGWSDKFDPALLGVVTGDSDILRDAYEEPASPA